MSTASRRLAHGVGARAGASYVVGATAHDLARFAQAAARRGFATDVCYWPRPGETPEQVAAAYVYALDELPLTAASSRLALKVSQLGFRPDALMPVLEAARRTSTPLIFDALDAGESDGVFALIEAAAGGGATQLACALAGRWPRSLDDLEVALAHDLHVRVVKGQYPDPAHPEVDPRAGFLQLVDRLAGRASFVSVATHEWQLAREAITRLRAAGTACELELLYGFPIARVLRALGDLEVPVRLYLPFGYGRTPYPTRGALRDGHSARFLLGDVVVGAARRRVPLPRVRGARLATPS